MLEKKAALEKDLKHYKKLKSTWNRIDLGLKIGGGILVGSMTIAGVVCGVVVAPHLLIPILAPQVPIIIGAVEGGLATILIGLNIGVTSRKKKYHKEKCKIVQSYLDKIWLYIEKARQDSIITVVELEGFNKLIEEYCGRMNGIDGSIDIDLIKFQKDIKKKAQKNLKKELIEERKQEYKSILTGNVVSATGTLQRR